MTFERLPPHVKISTFSKIVAMGLMLTLYASGAPPHIVMMVADDLGWGDVSWRGGDARTPHLDQLRMEGMELNRYYGHATCVPTRVALHTGRNPYRFGIVAPGTGNPPLDEHFLPQTLKQAGYTTRLVGKWHLGDDSAEYYPTSRGFDSFFGFLGGGTDYFGTLNNGSRRGWLRNLDPVTDTGYSTDLFRDEAVNVIRDHDTSQPLFLMVCFNAPHLPLEAPADLEANYPSLTAERRTYAAMIESMDNAIGAIMTELASQGMDDDTVVIFVSDNGAVRDDAFGSNGELSQGKGQAFDGGIRLPGIVRWTGRVPAGTVSDQVIADVDWLPTLATLAETTPGATAPLDGIDQSAAFFDATRNETRPVIVAAQSTYAFLDGLNKVTEDRNGNRSIHNLDTDPGENTDLSLSESALAASLNARLDQELARMRADFSSNTGVGFVNISVRARAGTTVGNPIPGFVLSGDSTKSMVIRAVGPTLADFDVSGVLADPTLSLIQNGTTLGTNSQWQAADATKFSAVGGFPLSTGSNDAALVVDLSAGSYTTPVTTSGNDEGVVLLEVYDGEIANAALQVVNTSTRAFVGTGDDLLVPGFVVKGTGTARLLIRAVGPGLSEFGVPDVLADPTMTLFRNGEPIATNDNWSDDPSTEDAATASGAFALTANSLDAAMLVSLTEGLYTVAVEGADGGTGTALFELYLAPSP
ncbi:MAG: hypothetical protein SynsKO_32750 [Synoicihabitans sp.]